MKPTLLYVVFGREHFFFQARFSVMSALAALGSHRNRLEILIYSDQTEVWTDLPVKVFELNAADLDAYMGAYRFAYRPKVVLLRRSLQELRSLVCYVDADTVFLRSPLLLFERIKSGKAVMHNAEGLMLSDRRWAGDTSRILEMSQPCLGPVIINSATMMWNAGVLGLSPCHHEVLGQAIDVMDAVYSCTSWRLAEQFALSVLLPQNSLTPASDVVEHYWDRQRQFHQLIHEINKKLQGHARDSQLHYCAKFLEIIKKRGAISSAGRT